MARHRRLEGFRSAAAVIGSVTVAAAVVLFLFGAAFLARVEAVNGLWGAFNAEAANEAYVLGQIKTHFGYGGFIHNFKNFVLRRDPSLIPKIEANRDDVLRALDRYESFNLTEEEKAALASLRKVVEEYAAKFEIARSKPFVGRTPNGLDAVVRVDDRPAVAALRFLSDNTLKKSTRMEGSTTQALIETMRFGYWGILIIPGVLGIGGLMIFFVRRLLLANERVEKARKRVDHLFDSAPEAMIVSRPDGSIVRINGRAASLFGYDRAAFLRLSIEDLVPKKQRRKHAKERAGYFGTPSSRSMAVLRELTAVTASGRVIPVEISLTHMDEEGECLAMTTVRDISERKAAEEALQASEERYRAFFANAGVAISLISPDGRHLQSNQPWLDMIGYSEEELAGLTSSDLIEEEDRAACDLYMTELLAGTFDSFRLETRFVCKDGGFRWGDMTASPLHGRDGSITAVMRVIPDITEQKEAQEEAMAAREEAEEALRKLERVHLTLVQSEKLAALGGLVAGVAHEINTPVGITLTAASHLGKETEALRALYEADELEPAHLVDYMNMAEEATRLMLGNCDRAAELIQSFKQVAVDQTGGERRLFGVKEFIEEVLMSLGPRLKKVPHKVVLDCPETLRADGKPGALSQCLTNLMMNALTHAFDEGQEGAISIRVTEPEPGQMEISFEDNGKGMSADVQEKVFDPFFTTKRSAGGSGLGLNIVYNIVRQTLHGSIKLRSAPGMGAEFRLRFPTILPRETD